MLRNSVLGLCWNARFGNKRGFLVHVISSSNHIKLLSTTKWDSARWKGRGRDLEGEGQRGQCLWDCIELELETMLLNFTSKYGRPEILIEII